MIKVNAIGDVCPIPVVKTKKAMQELNGAGTIEVLVDNEIAVTNVTKMASAAGGSVTSEKLAEKYNCVFVDFQKMYEDYCNIRDTFGCFPGYTAPSEAVELPQAAAPVAA